MFGKARYAGINALINQRLAMSQPLTVAHRGCPAGTVAPNTGLAIAGALASGADVVNLDVSSSSDQKYYCFHDGYEPELLGVEENIQTLTAAKIDKLSYIWLDQPTKPQRVPKLLPLLKQFAGGPALFIIDRSWWRWPHLLQALDILQMPGQLILKCPAWESAALEQLERFDVKYPLLPICENPTQAALTIANPDLNTVGVELITTSRDHPWFTRAAIDDLHNQGVFCLVNTLAVTTGVPLFGDLNDTRAITESPAAAYGPILDLGIDAIHTDWPWLVRSLRDSPRPIAAEDHEH